MFEPEKEDYICIANVCRLLSMHRKKQFYESKSGLNRTYGNMREIGRNGDAINRKEKRFLKVCVNLKPQ